MSGDSLIAEGVPESTLTTVPKLGYSFKEAQKITGLGRTTLWNAINEGRLNCFRVGRRRLFSLSHLQDFLKHYERAAGQEERPRRKRLMKQNQK